MLEKLERPDFRPWSRRKFFTVLVLFHCALFAFFWQYLSYVPAAVEFRVLERQSISSRRAQFKEKCAYVRAPAGPPATFDPATRREQGSDRFVPGSAPVLLRNGKIWTGGRNGTEIVQGDVFMDKGVVQALGFIPETLLQQAGGKLKVVDLEGKWVTPGLVDLHSHIGVYSAPALEGASDGNSIKAPIQPWLRSIDGLNTHDESYELAMAGGVTTAQILPGSANNIGGQAFVIKLRPTDERSVISKVVEPPATLYAANVTNPGWITWRHMKHACGENPMRVYSQTRMDGIWGFRNAYDQAKTLKAKQDAFCAKVDSDSWDDLVKMGHHSSEEDLEFPEDLQWESLVDVLRGRVKLSVHCYEAVDLDGMVRLTNEFKFPISSFHHAGETYLVPNLLKKVWPGKAPAIALFASNFKKKREAYRGSEFAPAILAKEKIPVVMKSDHPVINSRYLLFEAQQAHFYGLPPNLALASVTTTPADAAGLGHRVGRISEGYDADVVIWDSHPLALGATPQQVYVDGIPQLGENPVTLQKGEFFQKFPKVPDFSREAEETIKWDGIPPLTKDAWRAYEHQTVVLRNVSSVYVRDSSSGPQAIKALFDVRDLSADASSSRTIIVQSGKIVCVEGVASLSSDMCKPLFSPSLPADVIELDLQGGSIAPGLTSYGSPLGLVEIAQEDSTNDGVVPDGLVGGVPSILGDGTLIKAVDGLQFEGRNALLAYKYGVTTGVTAPVGSSLVQGLGTAFHLGAPHKLAHGAILQWETAVHVSLDMSRSASISTQIAALKHLLFGKDTCSEPMSSATNDPWAEVRYGTRTLVVNVENADIMATLIALKHEYESKHCHSLKITFAGASEAHLLADEIAHAGISVIITLARPYPSDWQQRRINRGPPFQKHTSITTLLDAGVNVAIGTINEAEARNARFEIGWAALDANGRIDYATALALASTNLEKALGVLRPSHLTPDLVIYEGGNALDFTSKPVGVVSEERGVLELF
ncbi:hypothetical protein CVT24_004823 [Panaeolus cyanescens]|uniref:Amidohydrolase-related domain-containing protein n=1 Tax=Panaeolus cyanescens TaxID=181874 RepID=A0A409W1X9_9AGAR|nr:hypothetical protein CVT24_004823 [Panaeolus cyanescens]